MMKLFHKAVFFLHIDPRVYQLEKEIENYQYFIFGLILLILLLVLIIFLQRRLISAFKRGETAPKLARLLKGKGASPRGAGAKAGDTAAGLPPAAKALVPPKDLPDPGLIFKYSLAQEEVTEKLIVIGQTEGNIKTYSTEVINNHLNISIRIIEDRGSKDIYDLPDKITEQYLLDLRRDGKVLIYYPGLEQYREMGSRERVYLKQRPDEAGDPTLPSIDARQPVRFRLGDRLDMDGKFKGGYFEFHLYTQEYEAKTQMGIPKIEKNFLIRLYKIYPGYDTGAPNADGLYPMIDPYATSK